MTTRERIVEESLTLFAKKGYQGTTVKDIAAAVGVKDSSLYKHFKSKQEILDTIVQKMEERMENMSESFGLPVGTDFSQAAVVYKTFDEDMLVAFSREVFLFYLKDPFVSRFWRMGMMEQFHNQKVYAVFSHIFLEGSIDYQTQLFEEMIRQHIFVKRDPSVIAMYFYTPIYFLLSKYAGAPEKEEEAVQILEKQVREFYRLFLEGEK